jgi:hypothetical protein
MPRVKLAGVAAALPVSLQPKVKASVAMVRRLRTVAASEGETDLAGTIFIASPINLLVGCRPGGERVEVSVSADGADFFDICSGDTLHAEACQFKRNEKQVEEV